MLDQHKAVFLDRDGTLIEPREYPSRLDEIVPFEYAGPALRKLTNRGYVLYVVTNQSGVAKGLVTPDFIEKAHKQLDQYLQGYGVKIQQWLVCPHNTGCDCRKPATGLLRSVPDVDYSRSWMIGDKLSDVRFGLNAGMQAVLVHNQLRGVLYATVNNLADAVEYILEKETN